MHLRHLIITSAALGVILLAGACASPHDFPADLTPIPTLIPATQPESAVNVSEEQTFTIQSYPVQLPSAQRGQPLYEANCAECHGQDGDGVAAGARNFNDLDYMRGESPAFFYSAVTEGRNNMPAFSDRLTSDERWDVVFYVWRFSTDSATVALGQQIYDANCVACHGEDGSGEVLGSADFTDLRQVDALSPRDFYLTVTQGKGSMPAWQGRLSQDDRWAVIDYLRTFSYDPALRGDTAAPAEPPAVAEEIACDAEYLSQANPFAWEDTEAILAGEVIYEQSCAMCHGNDGAGNLSGTPDFTSSRVHADLLEDAGEALCIVAEGREAMPGWKDTLSIEQMWQVLTFLGSLGQ